MLQIVIYISILLKIIFQIAGIATSSVGAATNIGTSLIERIINSKQVKVFTTSQLIRSRES